MIKVNAYLLAIHDGSHKYSFGCVYDFNGNEILKLRGNTPTIIKESDRNIVQTSYNFKNNYTDGIVEFKQLTVQEFNLLQIYKIRGGI